MKRSFKTTGDAANHDIKHLLARERFAPQLKNLTDSFDIKFSIPDESGHQLDPDDVKAIFAAKSKQYPAHVFTDQHQQTITSLLQSMGHI
jgi:hypothetical protein